MYSDRVFNGVIRCWLIMPFVLFPVPGKLFDVQELFLEDVLK